MTSDQYGDWNLRIREGEVYRDVRLSVQASSTHYCSPRVDGLPLESYETVEIALVPVDGSFRHLLPSEVGIQGYDDLFEQDTIVPVAGYVPLDVVMRLALELAAR